MNCLQLGSGEIGDKVQLQHGSYIRTVNGREKGQQLHKVNAISNRSFINKYEFFFKYNRN